jgi:hypothetical protein
MDNLDVYKALRQMGVDVRHLRLEGTLETARIRESDDGGDERPKPDWKEELGQPSRRVDIATGRSPLRYFLDGAQRTLPSLFTEIVPISSSINAVGLLERDGDGEARIAPGTLRAEHNWLVPTRSRFAGVNAVVEVLQSRRFRVVDPLDRWLDTPEYDEILANYDAIGLHAKDRASKLRQQLEEETLTTWASANQSGTDWIVVDGTIRRPAPRAIGIAKSFSHAYLSDRDYEHLLQLPIGHRSRGFRIQRRFPVIAWYLRLWDATGRDPRHALVRIETTALDSHDPGISDRIDEISGWILAERIPSAKADERWATLIYPIHQLERVLKRRLDMETRMWWKQS